ncbi:hypothetical protein RJ639_009116 [Escallonia herrerae]|uniref:Late embryogenesis abundant protein LEA-2 subgroup domain-containing protein n=1 Tax=Escallonia herrerae TaxID=1293975 RepID=A0AA88VV54_9ASTE|nr:hypothetical protein RJ639_009116 [Escallonia herrerae]
MTDRVYPSSKPNGTTATTTTTPAANQPKFPATKSQLYNPNRHPYRPTPTAAHRHSRRRRRRGCLCWWCFWSILLLLVLLLLAAITAAAAYALYRPQRPAFSVSSLRISQFNLTSAADDSTRLTTKFNLTISSKNPNKKIIFYYGPITITSLANQVQIANGEEKGEVTVRNLFHPETRQAKVVVTDLCGVVGVVVGDRCYGFEGWWSMMEATA